ncbi:hypothetical protein [Rehaibacterium terrae]|uniref:Uncharacterized protein n=1 Tax=Rehaibacterium terrae TaxID=1341696 RepID=A0A7W7XYF5_9GAMM|nr:hypothetical protein [Rehaibacterium terrae]MBB5014617.1 hypothetical protein [Rehaibacterium terrae]
MKLTGFVLACTLVAAYAEASDHHVTTCNSCSAHERQSAALTAAPPWSGVSQVYVVDNANRTVSRYEVTIESEPGFSLAQAVEVESEADVLDFARSVWKAADDFSSSVHDVPEAVIPSLTDYLSNSHYHGRAFQFVEGKVQGLFALPRDFTMAVAALLSRVIPTSDGKMRATLRFADGGTVRIEISPGIDVSTDTLRVMGLRVIPGSASDRHGDPLPMSREALTGGYERVELSETTLEDLARMARAWGIPVTCQATSSRTRIRCNQNGCVTEVIGRCH